jgi:hypothetical protein
MRDVHARLDAIEDAMKPAPAVFGRPRATAAEKAAAFDYDRLARDLDAMLTYGARPTFETSRAEIRRCIESHYRHDTAVYRMLGHEMPTEDELVESIERETDRIAGLSRAEWDAACEQWNPTHRAREAASERE